MLRQLFKRRGPSPCLVLANLLFIVSTGIASGQSDLPPGAAAVTPEQIQSQIARFEMASEPDAETRAKIVERYRSALRELTRVNDANAAAAQFQKLAETAAERAAGFRADRDRLVKLPAEPFDGQETTGLEAERAKREANIAVLKQRLKDVDAERKRRADRKAEIRELRAGAEARIAELRGLAETPVSEGEPAALTEAKRLEASLRLDAFSRSLPGLDLELAAYAAEEGAELLRQQEELTKIELTREEATVTRLTAALNERRQRDAEAQVREAERQKLLAHPLLQPLAERNRLEAEEVRKLSTKNEGIERETKQMLERLERLQAELADVRMKEAQIGLTGPIGVMLREQRSELPDIRELEGQLSARQELINGARLELWRHAEELETFPDAQTFVREAAASGGVVLSDAQRLELERMAAELLESRRNLLVELERASKRNFDLLFELDAVERLYLKASGDYFHYINERILWTRSADPLSIGLLAGDAGTRDWLFSTQNWRSVFSALAADPIEHPFAFWPTLLAVLALFYFRLSIRPRLRELGGHAGKRGFLRYGPTAQAAVLTVLSAITAPAALLFLSWRLSGAVDPGGFARAVGLALEACAAVLFPVELLRESCRHLGLAETHFAWPSRAVGHLRRMFTWMKTAGVPVTFFAVLAHYDSPLSGGTATERLLFIGGMALAAVTLHRLLSGHGELAKAFLVEQPKSSFSRCRRLWYATAVAVPTAFAGLSALGYHYSATQVAHRLLWTLWLAAAAVLIRAMAVRWVVLSRRRLLLDQAYQRRAAEEAQDSGGSAKPPVVEETDVAKTTAQTRKLVDIVMLGFAATGLWMIWADTLPAIGLLDRPVWAVEREVVSSAPSAEPAAALAGDLAGTAAKTSSTGSPASAAGGETVLKSVTTLDLAVAVALAIFTFLASRNLPGLMEMSVLNRLPVDNATRYAATRLASYAIVIVGVLMASNRLGLRWQNVQWLAAALTVGLGFGLQEVFANFVSGLIILFERPVRVGDVVTIDGVTGVVSRIRMRATTITNWDRKEFIVPNKEFITGRVLNWTLSDAVNRITINVGIAYGSDVEQARRILLRICEEQPLLLKDPAPMASFEGFGDGTLNLVLRCFLPTLDDRLDVTHELHSRIVHEFRNAGVEIALPQRDLRIRSADGQSLPFVALATSAPTMQRPLVERAAG